MTAEFNPAEGRFYLTGHRDNRSAHTRQLVYKDNIPADLICPDCKKKMNLGVRERCRQLQDDKIKTIPRKFMHLIPLVEVVASSLGVKSVSSRKVLQIFEEIMQIYPTEIDLWRSDRVKELLDKRIAPKTINRILAVQEGRFSFDPPGFDGQYGNLVFGE